MLENIKKIVVLGGGESGCGSAVLAKKQGFEVFLSDMGVIAENYKNIFHQYDILFEQGKHSLEKILDADLVIKSPGIPDRAAVIVQLHKNGVRVVSELEFAKYFTDAKVICITGSNGKTTITTLIYNMLKDGGYNVGLGGNIGRSFAMQVATQQFDWYVLEVSSFQLDGMSDFKADIAVLANITPDHLDRYDYQMEKYVQSKFRITNNQTPNDYFIYCADDNMIISHSALEADGVKVGYSIKTESQAARLIGDEIRIAVAGKELTILVDDIIIKGLHNISNVMASALAAMIAGVEPQQVEHSIRQFAGVEHRMEQICCVDDILYINDSKATNVDAVWYALESLTRPVVWIAGGVDKGNDYSVLRELAEKKVHTLICMGLENDKLIASFADIVPQIYETGSLEDAIIAIQDSANMGDVVILSPSCASFDMFDNYEQRGKLFKEAIFNVTKK